MTPGYEEPSLSWENGLLNAILEHVDQGILMVDAMGYVAVCNQRAIDLLGLPPDLMRSNPSFEDVKRWQLEQGEFGTVTEALLHAIKFEGINVEILDYERQRPSRKSVSTKHSPAGALS